eukprot:515938_1
MFHATFNFQSKCYSLLHRISALFFYYAVFHSDPGKICVDCNIMAWMQHVHYDHDLVSTHHTQSLLLLNVTTFGSNNNTSILFIFIFILTASVSIGDLMIYIACQCHHIISIAHLIN